MGEYEEELATERSMKDQFMAHHAESPFVSERVHGFSGLAYFPPDPKFRVTARLERAAVPSEAYLRTNRDGQSAMRLLGELVFDLLGTPLRLRVFHAGEGVGASAFVPFRDRTSGRETYGPGRYLTLELNEEDVYDLDFNRAFNPYCAYTDAFECPFAPVENSLPVAVTAGERTWSLAAEKDRTPPPAARPRPAARRGKPRAPARKSGLKAAGTRRRSR